MSHRVIFVRKFGVARLLRGHLLLSLFRCRWLRRRTGDGIVVNNADVRYMIFHLHLDQISLDKG